MLWVWRTYWIRYFIHILLTVSRQTARECVYPGLILRATCTKCWKEYGETRFPPLSFHSPWSTNVPPLLQEYCRWCNWQGKRKAQKPVQSIQEWRGKERNEGGWGFYYCPRQESYWYLNFYTPFWNPEFLLCIQFIKLKQSINPSASNLYGLVIKK